MESQIFADNLERLLGMHGVTHRKAADALGISSVAISTWRQGTRSPSVRTLLRVAEVFEVDATGLMTLPFAQLLPTLSDPERFERVERRLKGGPKSQRRSDKVTPLKKRGSSGRG
ncbi:MAG: helix-turn-helix transcriptional regulator [Actinomycetota bacterium]|nr:helix-turn-helix transcriptional regulator [Actinomycetota bacterium]